MALFKNINESGVGIAKDAEKKRGIVGFFKIFGRKFWELFLVNMLYMLFYIPLVLSGFFAYAGDTMLNYILAFVFLVIFAFLFGPATAGMFKVLRNYVLEQPNFMAHTFFKGFKQEYKKNLAWGIVDILMCFSVYSAVKIYPVYLADSSLKYVCLGITGFVALTILIMNFYFFLFTSATNLSFKDSVKDSFCMVSIALKKNILTLIISALILGLCFLLFYILGLWILAFFFPIATVGLVVTYNSYPYIQKYVINPYYREQGKVNPEVEYEYAKDVAIFEDMGGKEKPIKIEKKKKVKSRGGKDIS